MVKMSKRQREKQQSGLRDEGGIRQIRSVIWESFKVGVVGVDFIDGYLGVPFPKGKGLE